MSEHWKITDIEDKLQKLEEEVITYANVKKGKIKPNCRRLRQRIPFEGSVNLEKEKKIEEHKTKLANHNELFYFAPAQTAVALTIEAIELWNEGNEEVAIAKQKKAIEHFDHLDFHFNLGKMYLESGIDYEEGIYYLLTYFVDQSYGDYYKSKLTDLLHIDMEDNIYFGHFDNGSKKINFEIENNEITYNNDADVFHIGIPLTFKIPISLDLEKRDKEIIKMRDYWYITHLYHPEMQDTLTFEIKIHENQSKPFIEEFYSSVLELSKDRKLEELAYFDRLKHQLYMYNLKKQYYHQGVFGEPFEVAYPQNTSLLSILLIDIPTHHKEEFFDLFKSFALEHLYTVDNEDELDKNDIRSKEEADEALFAEYQVHQERTDEYIHFVNQAEYFATLTVLLDNLKKERVDPYHEKNEALFLESKQKYLSHLGDLFSDIQHEETQQDKNNRKVHRPKVSQEDKLQEKIDEVLNLVNSERVREALKTSLHEARQSISTPRLAIGAMRFTLEVLMQECCLGMGKSIKEGHRNKSLFLLVTETKDLIKDKTINTLIYKIRTGGNTALHYDALIGLISFSKEEVEQHLHWLLQIIEFYVRKTRL
ncbi:hypothetical protein [Fredinandcohnia onubensis]|uniref:hypothetical protein n=1 Tax=Fredinandcohnia onubensis TaxID=1571209 RepID=UPI000C0C09EF|nr:hypothetical protein [Fredinandcohnia onubensis]